MICPGCRNPVTTLVCRACAARKSREVILEAQREFLPRAVAGEIPLRLTRTARPHVMVYGPFTTGTFCGIILEGRPKFYSSHFAARGQCCPDCLRVIDQLVGG